MSLSNLMQRELLFKSEIKSPEELNPVIMALKSKLSIRSCVLLKGKLAAGKTTFVQKYCEVFGITNVSSPTFSLHHAYEKIDEAVAIDHFDLYRLSSIEEIETCGLWESFDKRSGLIFIEWPERISELDLPLNWNFFEIDFDVITNNSTHRIISLSRLFR